MRVGEALQLIGGSLGKVSKMPGLSYGISAHACITGSKLVTVPGSVCFSCYAMKGQYIYNSVHTAHKRRLASITGPHWTAAMVFLIGRSKEKYFRWHDSGDLQSTEHLTKICAVAALTPKIRHWLPTRELQIVLSYVKRGGIIPANLTIRVSGTMINGTVTKQWLTTSSVHTEKALDGAYICPAPQQDHKCGECRACWDKNVALVSYRKH